MQPMEPTQPMVPESTVPLGQQAQWDDNPRAEDLLDHWNGADVLRVELEISNLSDNDIVDGINTLRSIADTPRDRLDPSDNPVR